MIPQACDAAAQVARLRDHARTLLRSSRRHLSGFSAARHASKAAGHVMVGADVRENLCPISSRTHTLPGSRCQGNNNRRQSVALSIDEICEPPHPGRPPSARLWGR